jgi:HEAT repeat protein
MSGPKQLFALGVLTLTILIVAAGGTLIARARGPIHQGRPVAAWFKALDSEDFQERDQATAAVLALGAGAVPHLKRQLRTRDQALKLRLLAGLRRISPVNFKLVNPAVLRQRAATMLGKLGPAARAAAPALVHALNDQQESVSFEAAQALRSIGAESVPWLLEALGRPEDRLRAHAAKLLREFPTEAHRTVPPLVRALEDQRAGVRQQAAVSLGVLGRGEAAVLRAALPLLNDPASEVRAAAAEALGRIGLAEAQAIAALERAFVDRSAPVRVQAAGAHWLLAQRAEIVLPVLIAALQEPEVHWQAALALGRMGTHAEPAIPALIEALQREKTHRPVRTPASAALALREVGPAAVPALTALLTHARSDVRIGAAIALAKNGAHAKPAVPHLIEMLGEAESELRQAAAYALGAIGPAARAAVPALEAAYQEPDEFLRDSAGQALSRILHPPTTAAQTP